jgi:hypothetical protein
MNTSSGHSSMSTSSLLEANDIVWELVKKPFSAQQNIRDQRQIFRHARLGKVFKCRGIQIKNGLG